MDRMCSLEKDIADLRKILRDKEAKLCEIRKELSSVSDDTLNVIYIGFAVIILFLPYSCEQHNFSV